MFQIYVPLGVPNPQLLQQLGLAGLCADGDQGSITPVLAEGPDDGGGLLIEFGKPTGKWKASVWDPCWPDPKLNLPAGRFWWGFPKSGLKPEMLAYQRQFEGTARRLGDGNVWMLPNMLSLPHRFTGDPQTGLEVREVHPDWTHLYERLVWAFDWCQLAIEKGLHVLPETECREYLCEVLGVNYRINRELVLRLRLLDGDWWNRLASTTDVQKLMAIEKELREKKVAETKPG